MKRNKTIRILLSLIVLLTTGGVSRVCAETIDNVSYRDANGQTQTADNVTVLTGSETTLAAGWYIARGELNYTSTLTLNGTVNLILEDNAVMTVGTEAAPVVGNAITANGDFTIYSQGGGTTEGKLIAIGSNDPSETYSHHYGIYAEANLTINGGIINATGGDDGIKVRGKSTSIESTLTINGGDITAKGTIFCGFYGEINACVVINGGKFKAIGQLNNSDTSTRGISTDRGTIEINGGEVNATGTLYGIATNYQGNIMINGGQVTATSTGTKGTPYGIYANGRLTLSWMNSDDFIYTNSYGNSSIKTISGKKFIAYNTADGFAASGIIQGQGSEGYISTSTSSINGKYLRPRIEGNLVQVDAAKGITASGYKRAYDINTTHYYIYESGDEVTLNLPNYGQNGAEFTSTPANTIANVETTDGSVLASTSFQMSASDVTITDAKYYNYEVDYQTWNATDQKLVSAQTDANTKVYILEGTHDATTLDGGWYFVKNTNTDANVNEGIDANYTGRLTFSGEAHLILADGSDMNINYNSSNNASNYGIQSNNNFYIHRQGDGEGTGKLTIRKSGDGLGISLGGTSADFVMTGGILDVKSPGTCIATSNGNINIYGGKVTAKSYKLVGEEEQISDYYAFNANGAINILGGQVEAYGGGGDDKIAINAKAGDLTLGWTNPEDYIKASSYKALTGYNVKTAIGKRFVAYNAETGATANASSLSLGSATSTQATEIPTTISTDEPTADLTIAGKCLRPFDGYYVKDEAGLTFSGKTNDDGSAKPDFTITTGTGNNAVTTPYYIYKANTEQNPVSVVVNSTGHADDHMEINATTATAAITQSDAEASSHCFAMPAEDVTITGIKFYTYGVDYIDPTAAANEQAKTTPENTKVYILEGNETTLGAANTETWHVAQGTLNYARMLKLNGTFNLILADNAAMTVESGSKNTYAISTDATSNITIYGQSKGTGSLTATGTNETATSCHGIYPNGGSITINGGKVKAIAKNDGIHYYDNTNNPGGITINGGELEAIGTTQSGIYMKGRDINVRGGKLIATGGNYGISYLGNFTISGGQVETNASSNTGFGIHSDVGNITLGWTNPTDYVIASYKISSGHHVKTAAGKRFIAYKMANDDDISANCIIGSTTSETTLNDTDLGNIAGKTLRPLDGYYVKDEAGLTFDGKTNADGSAKPDFTITTGTGNNAVTTPYYIYKANTEQNPVSVVVNSTGHADDHMEINATTATAAITQSDTEASSHCFAMPAEDVTITGIKFYTYGVDYIDPTAAANEQAKTTSENTKVYILEGTHAATTLDGGWYVVKNTNGDSEDADLAYTGKLTLNGDVNFILGDKAKTTINSVDDHGIETSHKIAFFAQSKGNSAGSLSIESTSTTYKMYRAINAAPDYQTGYDITINGGNITLRSKGYAIYCGTLTINGGIVDASSSNDWGFNLVSDFIMNDGQATVIAADKNSGQGRGLYAGGNITINGGQLTAKGSTDGLNAMYNLTINGGKVTALYTGNQQYKNAICSRQGNITLGWTNPDDYIYTNSYHLDKSPNPNQVIKIAAGKRFVAYNAETGVAANASSLLLGSISSTDATEIPNTISLDDATANLTIAGKYLRPLDGYTVANSAGVLLDGKTETVGNNIVAKPDFTITNGTITTPYYIYKENATVTVASTGHDTDHMEINADFDLNQTEEQALAHSFQMLDKDIILQNVKYYNVKVPYLTWDDTEKKLVSAETGDYDKVYLLQGTETTLSDNGETWYVAKGNVDYTNKLTLNHGTHIILADNAKMTVTVTDANAIGAKSADITIYGQSTDAATMGRLTTDSNTGGIVASSNQDINVNVTINGGYIDVSKGGIYSSAKTANVIINGGIVEAESIATFADGDTKVIINSGNVTVSDEIEPFSTTSTAETILSWINPTDYVNAKSYSGTVKIAQGKYFSTSDASYGSKDADYEFGAGENPAATVLNNVKLMPTVAVQTGNAAFLDMCSTDGCYKVMGNAKAFPVVGYDITHKTVKLGAALAGVPNGVPVVICMVDGEGNPTDAALGADVMLVCATGQDAIDIQNSVATEGGNMPSALFFAGDANKTWEQLLEAAMQSQYPTADATQLASLMSERMFLELANGRFRPVAVNLANTSKLGKALLTITKYDFLKMIKAPATAAPGFHGIAIELGEETGVTGVREVKEVREVKDNTWYSLDGRKLDGAPNKKGIYVVNGHKVVIR